MIKQEVQANEQNNNNNNNNNNNKRERIIFGEEYQPLVVTPKVKCKCTAVAGEMDAAGID